MASKRGTVTREKVTRPMNRDEFLSYVRTAYGEGLPDVLGKQGYAERLWEITLETGLKNEACDGGFFSCTTVGGPGRGRLVMITDHSEEFPGGNSRRRVAGTPAVGYTSPSATPKTVNTPKLKENVMPARPKAKVAAQVEEPEVEETDEAPAGKNWAKILEKDITPTMEDFATWLDEEVLQPNGTSLETLGAEDPVRLVSLAGTQRMEFQQSEFNKTQRANRKATRAAAVIEEDDEEEADEAPAPKATKRPTSARPKPRGKVAATTDAPF